MPAEKRHSSRSADEANVADEELADAKKRKRTFHCQFCAKQFLRNEHLRRHERLHTKEKPFCCSTCSASFTRKDLLSRHLSLSHPITVVVQSNPETNSSQHGEVSRHPSVDVNVPDNMSLHTSGLQGTDFAHDDTSTFPADSRPPGSCLASPLDLGAAHSSFAPFNDLTATSVESTYNTPPTSWVEQTSNFDDFSLFIDSLSLPHANHLSTFYVDQPAVPFSPTPLFSASAPQSFLGHPRGSKAIETHSTIRDQSRSHLFDDFSSTFPSFESTSSSSTKSQWEPWRVTQADWDHLLAEIQIFSPLLAQDLLLPSRHTLCRYIATYVTGCHRHLPFLHIPTFSPTKWPVEMILAMAAIGAQYSFDNDNAVKLFRASSVITLERLRERKAELRAKSFSLQGRSAVELGSSNSSPPQFSFVPQEPLRLLIPNGDINGQYDALPPAQTLLLLLVMATWANSKAIFNEASVLRGTLAEFIREERLLELQTLNDTAWSQWVQIEGLRRTVSIAFCFFNFHTILYNTPPPILNSELHIRLPSQETVWEARSETEWQEARRQAGTEPQFQSCYSLLFSKDINESYKRYSSLGGYVLILALIQHIYFLREMSRCKPTSNESLPPAEVADSELALRNWQHGWNKDPVSCLSPGSPQGPISFNSTALLRMAYIRLNVDVSPWRALGRQDPLLIARSLYQGPPVKRSHKMTRVVLYSAHALSIPVKIGVNVVARNQAYAWPPGHSLCALECAFLLSKWLIAVQSCEPEMQLDEDEVRLLGYIADMVAEADPEFRPTNNRGIRPHHNDLCVRVVRIWARLMGDEAVWDIVRMVGKVLKEYGQILAQDFAT